jgi:type II protein arginine methyltransferase
MKVQADDIARLIETAPSVEGQPLAQLSLARGVLALGHAERARELAEQAVASAPANAQVLVFAAEVLSHDIPEWHFNLVRDEARNAAYDGALRRAVRPDTKVLEIGSGSGILAMMAARAGAREVITCEASAAVAAVARANIARNGFADRIRVVNKHSSDLDVSVDLGGPADLLVSEIVSNTVIGEDVLPVMEDSSRRLLRPGAAIIPARAVARVALARSEAVARNHIGIVEGFDLGAMNRLAPPRWELGVGDASLSLCSQAHDLFVFDFEPANPHPADSSSLTLTTERDGANCVVQWLRLGMDATGVYENRPTPGASSCWAVLAYPFHPFVSLEVGREVLVHSAHDRAELRLWAEPV